MSCLNKRRMSDKHHKRGYLEILAITVTRLMQTTLMITSSLLLLQIYSHLESACHSLDVAYGYMVCSSICVQDQQ